MKKILFITYVFPPIAYAGTYRTLRLCKYLVKMGYEISVLTINIQGDLHNDFKLLEAIQNEVNIERTKTVDLWRIYQKIKGRLSLSWPGRMLNKIIIKLLFLVNQPDHMVFWVPFAVIRGLSLIKKNKHHLIYTSSPPHSEQIVGLILKYLTGVKWIADFRDPIVGNIASEDWTIFEKLINTSLEKRIIKNADAIIVNTNDIQKKMQKRYNVDSKIYFVANSFDEDDFKNIIEKKYENFTISHIGFMYSFRKADLIFESMKRLNRNKSIDMSRLKIQFVGINDNTLKSKVEKFCLHENIDLCNMVPHSKALRIMMKSHMLLLIKGGGENSAGQIPGKLFEYLGAGNKIIYIGPKKTDAADIIRETNTGYIIEDDIDELSKIITTEYNEYRQKRNTEKTTNDRNDYLFKYTSQKMAENVSDIIESIL